MKDDLRAAIVTLSLSAIGLMGIMSYEGFTSVATPPVPGDVPTYGYGTTTHADGSPVISGETITPQQALERLAQDMNKFEGAVKKCVKTPLYQYEYDAYISLSYNIGAYAFCHSTLVRKLNAGDYSGACAQIKRWNKLKGKELRGLTNRREKEYRLCMGEKQ